MTKDYCEILLDSVRTVVDFETQKQKYKADHVEICTIIDNSGAQDEDIVYYWVQNDAGQKYQVNSELKNLRLGDQLYVQVLPDGQGRTVLGRKLSDANLPISVVRAFDRFFSLESFTKENFIEEKYIVSSHEKYTRLGIECKVNDGDETDSITLNIRLNNGDSYNITFSTEDMLGDPSTFENILQKKIFDISNLGDKIKEISYSVSNTERFSDIVISLGYDLDSLKEETPLHLYTNNSTEYKTDINSNFVEGENGARTLAWRWIYEDDNGNLQGINSAETIPDGYECYLYEYDEDNDTGDMYGGLNWQRIEYTTKVTLKPSKQENKYKLVITYNGTYIVSNELVFVNKQMEKPTAIKNLKFKFDDGSNGQYPYYEYDGYLAEAFIYEGLVNRTVSAQFQMESTAKVTKVVWTVPMDLITVVAAGGIAGAFGEEIEINAGEDISELFNLKYKIKETCNFSGENDQYLKCAIYVEGEDAPYTYEQQIVLRVEGSNGTDNYVVARFYNARSGLKHSTKPEETTYLEVNVYNGDGIDITNKIVSVGCSWHGQTYNYEYDEFGVLKQLEDGKTYSDLIALNQEKDEEGNLIPNQFVITFKNTALTMFDCCKYISLILHLEIALSGEDVSILTKDLTLPIRYDNVVYQGPTIIQYNYEGGSPKCVSSSPQLLKKDTGEIIEDLRWFLATNDKFSGYPEYDLEKNVLVPRSSYDSTLGIAENRKYYLCNLIGYKGEEPVNGVLKETNKDDSKIEIYWIQPIQIIQNRYFSTIIDDWDGQMEINEEGNYILASTLAAGTKNDYNQFSGAIIGTFGTLIDGEKKTETGIKGFKDGARVYEFNDSGEAIIGPSGSGQIKFDGWNGSITSGGFDGKINPTANKAIQSLDDIGTKGSYWNLNTGELITNDGYFRGTLHANKLFISDEVKEESGIISKTSFKNYADADQAIFESEIEYATHKADTETRANARISSFVDEQQAINSLQASYSFDKQGVPTENYIVSWGSGTQSADGTITEINAPEIDFTRVYDTNEGYQNNILVWYGGPWTDYFILKENTTQVSYGAFSDVHGESIKLYYQGSTKPTCIGTKTLTITFLELPATIVQGATDSYPRMSWDTSKKYYYKDKLWYYEEGAWQDDGELFKDITDVRDNSRIALWYPKLRYRCENFYIHQYTPLSFSWAEITGQSLPDTDYFTDPGKEKRLLNNVYYSKEPTHLEYNGKEYAIASESVNSNLNKEFFRNGGGAYRQTDGTYKYWTSSTTSEPISTDYIYYSHEFNAYYRYEADATTDWLAVAAWIKTSIEEIEGVDPTDEKNLGLWSPKKILKYNNHYYSYDFQSNKWVQRQTQTYSSITSANNALKTNNFNNRTSYIFLIGQSPTEGYVHYSSPKGEWQLFRIDENAKFKYNKYTATINKKDNAVPVVGPVPQARELDSNTKAEIVLYNKDYYIRGEAVVAEDEEVFSNFYKLDPEEDIKLAEYKDDTPEINNEVYLTINNYIDRLCTYPQSENGEEILEPKINNWTYDKQFDDSTISTNDKVYTVDENLTWTPREEIAEGTEKSYIAEIYHIFDIDHIYKVGDDFYEYDETSGWHKIKTAAATSASLVQWANAAGAQSALTTQFVAGLNKNIVAVPKFDKTEDASDEEKKNCYYDLSTGKYWVWNGDKWVEYVPSMSTAAKIEQKADNAQAQLNLTAEYTLKIIYLKDETEWPSSSDTKKTYYIQNKKNTDYVGSYQYLDKEEEYNNLKDAGYDDLKIRLIFDADNKIISSQPVTAWDTSAWYRVSKNPLSSSIAGLEITANGLESRMSMTVGYGDNADIEFYTVNNPVEFIEKESGFKKPCIVYIVKSYPNNNDTAYVAGYYYLTDSSTSTVMETLPESIDLNGKTIKLPKLGGIMMKADSAGASIDLVFGSGEGHILQLQEDGSVFLRAKDIDFETEAFAIDVRGPEAFQKNTDGSINPSAELYPLFYLNTAKQVDENGNLITDADATLKLGGLRIYNQCVTNYQQNIVDYIFMLTGESGGEQAKGINVNGKTGGWSFAVGDTFGIQNKGDIYFGKSLYCKDIIIDSNNQIKTNDATGMATIKTASLSGITSSKNGVTTYPSISSYDINAQKITGNSITITEAIKGKSLTIENGSVAFINISSFKTDTIAPYNEGKGTITGFKITNCDISDYLKKNDLEVTLNSVTLFNQSHFVDGGANGEVTYYKVDEDGNVIVDANTFVGGVTYNGNKYYTVLNETGTRRANATDNAIRVPTFNTKTNYYKLGYIQQNGLYKVTVPAWSDDNRADNGEFYSGSPTSASITIQGRQESYTQFNGWTGKEREITEDDVGQKAIFDYTKVSHYIEAARFSTTVTASYTIGEAHVSITT